mgnify:CR=1 FL=1
MNPKKLKSNKVVALHEKFRTNVLLEHNGILIPKDTLGTITKVTETGFEFTEVFRGFKFKFKNSEFAKDLKEY